MISTVTTTTSTVLETDIMSYSIIAIVTLISFLIIKEILSAKADKSPSFKRLENSVNIAIVPLLLIFIAVLAFKITSLL